MQAFYRRINYLLHFRTTRTAEKTKNMEKYIDTQADTKTTMS